VLFGSRLISRLASFLSQDKSSLLGPSQ
jgi:hypothetical protein